MHDFLGSFYTPTPLIKSDIINARSLTKIEKILLLLKSKCIYINRKRPNKVFTMCVLLILWDISIRYRPRFLDQVGHQTMSAHIENKHFFTKSCHRQAYPNYEQPPRSSSKFAKFVLVDQLLQVKFIENFDF